MNRLTRKLEKSYPCQEYEIENTFEHTKDDILNKLGQLEDLEEQLGCPLDVRCKVLPNSYIFTFGTSMESLDIITRRKVITISEDGIYISYATASGKERDMTLSWKAYKKTWWLKKDRSE